MAEPRVAGIGVRAMLAAFADLGLDGSRIRDAAGLPDRELDDPERQLPASALYRMWEVADRLWGRPALGLEVGARVPFGAYEVLDYLLATGATLGEGLRACVEFYSLATRTASYRLDESGELVRCELSWRIPPRGVMLHLRDYTLAVVSGRVKRVSGAAPAGVEVDGPPLAAPGHYDRALGTHAELRAERTALLFTRERWSAPLPGSDPHLHRTLRRYGGLLLARATATASESVAQLVRSELLERLQGGAPSIDAIARALGLGPRTLQRQLRREGLSFAFLVDEVRAELAFEYLRDAALSVSEVAYRLGFSAPSAFSRAFRRWAGRSPEEFRQAS